MKIIPIFVWIVKCLFMKDFIFKPIHIVWMLCLFLSCGSTRTVEYVYVDRPVYSPAPATTYNGGSASTRRDEPDNRAITVINSAPRNTTASTSQNPRERILQKANQRVKGCYRGFGSYSCDDLDLAIDMAQANAVAQMGSRAITQIQRSLDGITNSTNSQAKKNACRVIKQRVAEYTVSDWRVVDSYVSNGPTYEVYYCVEASASDIIADLNPILKEMDSSDREQVVTVIKEGGR